MLTAAHCFCSVTPRTFECGADFRGRRKISLEDRRVVSNDASFKSERICNGQLTSTSVTQKDIYVHVHIRLLL